MAVGHAQRFPPPGGEIKFLGEAQGVGSAVAWEWAKEQDFLTFWRAARAAFLLACCPWMCVAARARSRRM
eukprot:121741-Pelagomonas_calceolata.AAC.1